jgi:hypothetical protein
MSALLIGGGILGLSLFAHAAPFSFDSPWSADEGLSITSGDVSICEAALTLDEETAIGRLHLAADQDSPFFGVTSRAEKRIQFERAFTTEEAVKVALFAELTGALRIEGGTGEVFVRATVIVFDAAMLIPIAGMEISSSTIPDRFAQSIRERGELELSDSGVQVGTLSPGSYIVVGSLEAAVEMSRGWWNRAARADVFLRLEFLAGS